MTLMFLLVVSFAKIGKIGERGKDYFPIVSFTLASRFGTSKHIDLESECHDHWKQMSLFTPHSRIIFFNGLQMDQ